MVKYESLALPDLPLGPIAKPRRLASISEAIAWPTGRRDSRVYTPVYSFPELGYEVGVEKPGKEAFEVASPNLNDMWPVVRQHGRTVSLPASFLDLYVEFETIAKAARTSHESMHLLGPLLYRSSYMLDHHDAGDDVWRWDPPTDVMLELEARVEHMGGIPTRVYLHLVEIIALQEDVKYWTLRGGLAGATGRVNNLQTCAHLIATCIGKISIMHFAGHLSRAGVAPIPQKRVRSIFPLLQAAP